MQIEYDVKNAEFKDWKLRNLYHLLGATRTSLVEGGNWLVSRIYPTGPILHERDLNYIYKGVWGMHSSGVHASILSKCFRWIETALKPNGDFYFEEEPQYHKIGLRGYRAFTILKVAAWVDDPLAHNNSVLERLMQYQDRTGGVYDYIGEKPGKIEDPVTHFTALNTSFFGHTMVALDRKEAALKTGEWLRRFVEANVKYIHEKGIMYTETDIRGNLKIEIADPDSILGTVNLVDAKQEFWQVGVVMSYLALLYDVMRTRWGFNETEAQPMLKMALELNEFESRMPLYTYRYPSKCKVGWGAGELLRVLSKYRLGTQDQIEKALNNTKNTLETTFIDNQLPNGAWSCDHYVVSKKDVEYQFEYKPLKGLVNVPAYPLPGTKTSFIEPEELAGEFLGEMKAGEDGIVALIDSIVDKS
ncbi:MAG: hypothetical protein ACHQ03_05630 [Candidatus Bathyarchaeia archaeon]